ncbi:twin-arginine translocase subunit TatC [Occultella glacieicola]|uniref:Sec-independent protein translocase protein TatC n=1 Tax=Occultella glacieicola TaxID=2518684 RepID=A0ABY2E4P1_9MICO|nr:twin-arginine translocase subunit TatC [Occultella glacieicola]TDE92813.1 twin-arginine translocase subunit TatC [Occultella glacieicola]
MALTAHLRELRKRVVLAAIGLAVGAVVGWILYDPVFKALQAPVDDLVAEGRMAALNFGGIATSFDIKIRVALFVGAFISSPWWIYQAWAFITPGLTKKERRNAIGFVAAAVPLFLAGAYLAWSVLPNAVRILTEFTPEGSVNWISADVYLKFVMQFMLAFGAAFLMPLVMVVVTFLGLVRGTTWLKGWRWALVGIFTFCAFATPTPDAISMILLALPIIALYFIAVLICIRHDKRRDKRRAEEDAKLDAALADDTTSAA